jgi:ketosteroid isomerase-like protein
MGIEKKLLYIIIKNTHLQLNKNRHMKNRIAAITLLSIFIAVTGFGQQQIKKTVKKVKPAVTQQSEMYYEILKTDSALFAAFNNCDTVAFKKFFTDDLEFYHDKGGLHFLATELQAVKEMCDKNYHIRWELIKSSLEVYQLGDYGAVQIGTHRMYHTNKGESEHISGDYKFIHVWQKKEGVWKLSRIISYGHDKMNNN